MVTGYKMVALRYDGRVPQTLTVPGEYSVSVSPGQAFEWPEKWLYKLVNRGTAFTDIAKAQAAAEAEESDGVHDSAGGEDSEVLGLAGVADGQHGDRKRHHARGR